MEEPLVEGYPLIIPKNHRGQFSLTAGFDTKANYHYPKDLLKEERGPGMGLYLSYGRKANWDTFNRFYFGGVFHYRLTQNQFTLLELARAREIKQEIGLGPYISYDTWRTRNYRITLQGSVVLNWNHITVKQTAGEGYSEERYFQGFSASPRLGSFFQINDVIPKTDFVMGMDFQLTLPRLLPSSTPVKTPELWQEADSGRDVFSLPLGAYWGLFVGFQSNY